MRFRDLLARKSYATNQPFLAGTSGSALAGVPAATLTLAASTLSVPVVILT